MNSKHSLQADMALVAVTLLAAAGWIFSKEALVEFTPFTFIGLRFAAAGVILGLFGWQAIQALSRPVLIQAMVVGGCFGTAMVFWVMGLYHGNHIGVGAFLTSLGVVLVPLVAIAFGERPAKSLWFSLPVSLLGLVLLMANGELVMGWGEVSFLAAACIFAVTFVLNSRAAARIDSVALTAIQLFIVGLIAIPLALLTEQHLVLPAVSGWGWFAAAVLIATCARFFLQTWGQGKTSASNAAVIMVAEPVWSASLAAVWFGERMTPLQVAGCGLIFVALLASRWSVIRRLLAGT